MTSQAWNLKLTYLGSLQILETVKDRDRVATVFLETMHKLVSMTSSEQFAEFVRVDLNKWASKAMFLVNRPIDVSDLDCDSALRTLMFLWFMRIELPPHAKHFDDFLPRQSFVQQRLVVPFKSTIKTPFNQVFADGAAKGAVEPELSVIPQQLYSCWICTRNLNELVKEFAPNWDGSVDHLGDRLGITGSVFVVQILLSFVSTFLVRLYFLCQGHVALDWDLMEDSYKKYQKCWETVQDQNKANDMKRRAVDIVLDKRRFEKKFTLRRRCPVIRMVLMAIAVIMLSSCFTLELVERSASSLALVVEVGWAVASSLWLSDKIKHHEVGDIEYVKTEDAEFVKLCVVGSPDMCIVERKKVHYGQEEEPPAPETPKGNRSVTEKVSEWITMFIDATGTVFQQKSGTSYNTFFPSWQCRQVGNNQVCRKHTRKS